MLTGRHIGGRHAPDVERLHSGIWHQLSMDRLVDRICLRPRRTARAHRRMAEHAVGAGVKTLNSNTNSKSKKDLRTHLRPGRLATVARTVARTVHALWTLSGDRC